MCGICGVVGIERPDVAEATVRRMVTAVRHRGPDDEGLLVAPPKAPHVALGIRRLSIIDLPGGHQPVFNEKENVAVIFNGEIYNFRELRQQLEAQGHVFRTRSDTEAIVHAYEVWGEDCVHHLRGMFAFAVLDWRNQGSGTPIVFLARDRLGIKPLYYTSVNGILLFASEVRALLASRWVPRRLSPQALESYLLFGSVAEPMTLVEGVFSLPPGHRLRVRLDARSSVRPEPYWNLTDAATDSSGRNLRDRREPARQIRSLLEETVRMHLIADVPLGLFLSSGLDSTALAALASREQPGIHSFTVVFPEAEFSEARLARETAKRFSTRHQELLLSGEELLGRLDGAISALDQPTMNGINTYFVSWAARQMGLKVALSGLGGDEVFGGYSTFETAPRLERLAALGRRLPRAVRRGTASAVSQVGARRRADAVRKLASLWRNPDALPHSYFLARALFTPEQVTALLSGVPPAAREESPWRAWLNETVREMARLDRFTGVSWLEMRSYLVNTLLRDTDAVSMNHSLEVRVPLLDHRLVEFVAWLPESVKRRGRPKALLVEALHELLPKGIVRQRKRTFTFPWEQWLRGPLAGQVAVSLEETPAVLQAALDSEQVRTVWTHFLAGRTSWSRPWSLYVLNEWARRHLAAETIEKHAPRASAAVRPREQSAASRFGSTD